MLELNRRRALERRSEDDEAGVALIAVLVVMLVGFIIVGTVAASVIFTFQANGGNKLRTQAFIAAESGRDQVLSQIVGGACVSGSNATFTAQRASGPQFTATGYTVPASASPGQTCPDVNTASIQIDSTGTANGVSTTIHSVYSWVVTQQAPGGVMTYFSGQFKATKATYTGDLVIRPDPSTGIGNFDCNSGGGTQVTGDLWVLAGNVNLGSDCTIDGSIYASGTVTISSSKSTVTGDIVALGAVDINGNKVTVGDTSTTPATGGNIYTDGTFNLDSKASIVGKYESAGIATIGSPSSVGNRAASVQKCGTITPTPALCVSGPGALSPGVRTKTPAASTFNPSLATVLSMTQWMDITATQSVWGSDVKWITGPCNGADIRSTAMAALSAPFTKVGVDYTACSGNVTINVGNGAITQDAVFLVKPTASMTVKVGTLTTTVPAPYPQLIFIHGDNGSLPNHVPECGVSPSANDSIDVASSTNVRMMIYTPCGLGMANHISFNGQYYSNDDGNARWVWPVFTCAAMKWGPVALGCSVKAGAAAGGGATPPTMSLGPLVSQTEQ